ARRGRAAAARRRAGGVAVGVSRRGRAAHRAARAARAGGRLGAGAAHMSVHAIPLERRTLHGHFSPDLEPVLTIDPGDSVRFRTLDAGRHWELEGEWIESRDRVLDGGHPLCGPIEVRGARAGATLVVDVVRVEPRDWGITFAGETSVVWRLDGETGTADDGTVVALAPFLGVIGM